MYLANNHNPLKNKELIDSYFSSEKSLKKTVEETDQLFFSLVSNWAPAVNKTTFLDKIKSLWTKKKEKVVFHHTLADETDVYPDWKPILDREWNQLKKTAAEKIALKPGENIRSALAGGGKHIFLEEGTYIIDELRVPSNTIISGAGPGKTILKLRPNAPKRSFVITNDNHVKGNHHILIEGITMDWSIERLDPEEKSSSGNNRSSCLTFANVQYGWVKNCEALNPGLHCFDVSSTVYDYSGDGHRARGGSRFVWIDNCTGSGFGDDGVTTHHSDYILITNCFMHDPSGRSHKKGFANSNGFEADDGSRYVWLINNASTRCFGGVEVKAHATSSAASNVHIIGHLSVNDNRSYNFRHIGHHAETDPQSKTALFLTATRIISVHPVFTELYAGSKPRALTISAYQYVVINGLRAIGDPDYNYKGLPIAGIQYKAKHIHIQDVKMDHFPTAGTALKVFGGANKADHITIQNVRFTNCGKTPLFIASDVKAFSLKNVTMA